MAKLKADLQPISDWVEFRLDIKPEVMDPPVIKVRLAPSSPEDARDYVDPATPKKLSRILLEVIAAAIVEWDLSMDDGTPIPCTDENKRKYLVHFVGHKVLAIDGVEVPRGKSPLSQMFGAQILAMASEPENFLKN